MSYAIIETGGKQLKVEPGRFYDIELLPVEPDVQVSIDKVLLIQNNGDVTIGQPFIEGATVEGTVMRHRRGKKVIVYKMQPKKKTRKKRGHRQEITQLMIDSITLNGAVISADAASSADEPKLVEAVVVESTPAVVDQPDSEEVSTIEVPAQASSDELVEAVVVEAAPAIADESDSEEVPTVEAPASADEPELVEAVVVEATPAVVDQPDSEEVSTTEAPAPADEPELIEAAVVEATPAVADESDSEEVSTVETADEPDAETAAE